MARRGPDAAGEWVSPDQRTLLGHRRLAVIEPGAAAGQPMQSSCGTVTLTFNGEIYNHAELRRELERSGLRFRTRSDTEVVLEMYLRHGLDMLGRLRGMFALALHDRRTRELYLIRDPYGIKPLYYHDDGWTVRAASQVKALLRDPAVPRGRDPAGLAGFYLLGSVPEPFTLYGAVRAVPAGSWVRVGLRGAERPVEYFSLAEEFHAATASEAAGREPEETLGPALADSVRAHLVADVPVGVLLSGGVDSGVLARLATEASRDPLHTVTVRFTEWKGTRRDESRDAEARARALGSIHHAVTVSRRDFEGETERWLEAMDQPSIDGVNVYFAARAVRAAGLKVALSGIGADELFGGYPSFRDVPRWSRLLRTMRALPGAGRLFWTLTAPFAPRLPSKLPGLLELGRTFAGAYLLRRGLFLPQELPRVMGKEAAAEGLRRLALLRRIRAALHPDPGSDHARVATLESSFYLRNQLLRDADWAGMAHSVELRVPFVDLPMLRAVAPWLARAARGEGKARLAVQGRWEEPAAGTREKRGFSTPAGEWLERSPVLDEWRRIPALREQGCPWPRRWAYAVARREAAT
jgi:asparagine synthase (glutamine-hydrolysing)